MRQFGFVNKRCSRSLCSERTHLRTPPWIHLALQERKRPRRPVARHTARCQDNRRRHAERIPTNEIAHKYGPDYKLIFVGDATMSPYEIVYAGGSVEHWNEEPGAVWIKRLLNTYPKAQPMTIPRSDSSRSLSTRCPLASPRAAAS